MLTISDGVAAGTRQDDAGLALAEALDQKGFAVDRGAVPDERVEIENALRSATANHLLVVTTGGTGLRRGT